MKLNTIKLISYLLCIFLLSDYTIALSKFSRIHLKAMRHQTLQDYQINSRNPLIKFAEGVMTGLSGGNTSWMKCLPEKWRESTEGKEETNFVGGQFNSMGDSGKKILSVINKIVSILCKVRGPLQKILGTLFKSGGRFFMEGRYSSNRVLTRRGFWRRLKRAAQRVGRGIRHVARKVSNGVRHVAHKVVSGVKMVANKVVAGVKKGWEALKEAGQWLLSQITGSLTKIKDFFRNLFASNTLKDIRNLLQCVIAAKDTAVNLRNTIIGIKKNIGAFSTINIPVIVKIIINLICDKDTFIDIINKIIAGSKEGNKSQQMYLFGSGLGKTLNYLGNARRRFR